MTHSPSPPRPSQSRKTPIAKLTMRKKLLFSLVTVLLFFAVAEGTLRLAGFQYASGVESMKFTFPLKHYDIADLSQEELAALMEVGAPAMQRDPDLFWKPVPGWLGHNSRGIHGPEFDVPKPPGLFRIVCLGDSCTHFGPDSYPTHVQAALSSRDSQKIEVINAGVAGYSSHQGLARLNFEVAQWQPDLVTVYFGWNDHWLSRGVSDRDQQPRLHEVHHLLSQYRTYQLLLAIRHAVIRHRASTYRVPLSDYADNLRRIKRKCDELHAQTMFITAPHALDLGIPEHLTAGGEVKDAGGLIALHGQYNDVVRQVAAEMDVPLVDLDREFDAKDKASLFIEDHIHLSQAGRMLAGRLIAEQIAKGGLLPPVATIPANCSSPIEK